VKDNEIADPLVIYLGLHIGKVRNAGQINQTLHYKWRRRGSRWERKAGPGKYCGITLITDRPQEIESREEFGHSIARDRVEGRSGLCPDLVDTPKPRCLLYYALHNERFPQLNPRVASYIAL
jgi:hypothetical protein